LSRKEDDDAICLMASTPLPAEVETWVADVAGPIVSLERHPARRETWLVETSGSSESTEVHFLRLDRRGVAPSVNVEAEVVEALHIRGIPVPALHAWNAPLSCALYEQVVGHDSIAELPADQGQDVMDDFVEVVAAWHRLHSGSLGVGLPWPATAEECARNRPRELSALTSDPGWNRSELSGSGGYAATCLDRCRAWCCSKVIRDPAISSSNADGSKR
jgi:hypothetical protein